jgi:hypothetical protein
MAALIPPLTEDLPVRAKERPALLFLTAGRPDNAWAELDRRERVFQIAATLPKVASKPVKPLAGSDPAADCRARRPSAVQAPLKSSPQPWTNPPRNG